MLFVSVLGDSISTYEGYNPPGYAVYYEGPVRARNGLSSVYDTWWAKVNQGLHAYLCVNNSFSGSTVTGDAFPSACCAERISNLKTQARSPDLVLLYIGFNDFGDGVRVRREAFRLFGKKDPLIFEEAYECMLDRINAQYPRAKIVCGTLMRTALRRDAQWRFPERFAGVAFEEYNEAIRAAAKKKRAVLADVASQGLRYETLDGSHPTREGHETLAYAWLKCLAEAKLL